MALLEELWNRNLVNIFVSSITLWEWITSLIALGFAKGLISYTYAAFLIFFLYKVNVLQLNYFIPVFILLLFFTDWTLGLIVSGFILRFDTKVQTFAWNAIWIISPLSAVLLPG
jgi:ABC-2 type transport system permease protein